MQEILGAEGVTTAIRLLQWRGGGLISSTIFFNPPTTMRIYAQNLPLFSKAIKQKIYSSLQIPQKALGHSYFYRKLFAVNTTESVLRSQIIAGIAYCGGKKNIGLKTRRANRAQRSNAQDK